MLLHDYIQSLFIQGLVETHDFFFNSVHLSFKGWSTRMNIFNSEAPTLSTFLALAGEPTVTGPGPSLPAATSRRGGGGEEGGGVVRVECEVFIRLWGVYCVRRGHRA